MYRSFVIALLAIAVPTPAAAAPEACALPTPPVAQDIALLERRLTLTPDPGNSLKLRSLARYDGPCADLIIDIQFSRIKLADGRLFVRRQNGFAPDDKVPARKGSPFPSPRMRGMNFVSQSAIEGNRLYIGLWRSKGRSVIARYDASGRPPVILITTRLTISGVEYFPCPDSPCGSIDLILRDSGATYQATLGWVHPGYLEWSKQ